MLFGRSLVGIRTKKDRNTVSNIALVKIRGK